MWGSESKEANAFNFNKIGVERLASLIRDAGFKALVDQRPDGTPFISSSSNGWRTLIALHGKIGDEYSSFQFLLWLTDEERNVSMSKMNKFNSSWRYIKGILDTSNNSLCLQMDVDLDGGVSISHVVSRITTWDYLVGAFKEDMRNA
jgi:hypothetical protein